MKQIYNYYEKLTVEVVLRVVKIEYKHQNLRLVLEKLEEKKSTENFVLLDVPNIL